MKKHHHYGKAKAARACFSSIRLPISVLYGVAAFWCYEFWHCDAFYFLCTWFKAIRSKWICQITLWLLNILIASPVVGLYFKHAERGWLGDGMRWHLSRRKLMEKFASGFGLLGIACLAVGEGRAVAPPSHAEPSSGSSLRPQWPADSLIEARGATARFWSTDPTVPAADTSLASLAWVGIRHGLSSEGYRVPPT